jgi:Fe2+ transport system protein FeoA
MSFLQTHTGSQTLDQLRPGILAAVLNIVPCGRPGLRLQELGLVPGADVEVLSAGETMLVRVGEQRLSLRRAAAEAVSVHPLG